MKQKSNKIYGIRLVWCSEILYSVPNPWIVWKFKEDNSTRNNELNITWEGMMLLLAQCDIIAK